MANETVVYTPDQNGMGSVPAWLAMNNGGFGNGLGGWGGGILGFLLGLFFGNGGWGGFGGWGNGFGGNAGGAGFLSNQINNDSGRELLMNAITSQGEASRTAISSLWLPRSDRTSILSTPASRPSRARSALSPSSRRCPFLKSSTPSRAATRPSRRSFANAAAI